MVTSDCIPKLLRESPHFAQTFPKGRIRGDEGQIDGLEILRQPTLWALYDQVVLWGLVRRLKQLDPDVVHSHSILSPASMQCAWIQPQLGYRLFVDDHSTYLNTRLDNPIKGLYATAVSRYYRTRDSAVSKYLPVTAASSAFLTQRMRVPMGRQVIVGLGADTSLFHPDERARQEVRLNLGVKDDEQLIVSAGKFRTQKRIADLLRAFSMLTHASQGLRLLLVGDAEPGEAARLERLISKLRIGDRVTLIGFVNRPQLSRIYNAADIGVWPGEPSITVLEALATSLACVLPANEDAYLTIREENACVSFSSGDPVDLSKKIDQLAGSSERRREVGSNARDLVDRRLSWHAIAARLSAIYETT